MSHRKLIYHPSGKAGEYADKGFAVNLFKGCLHGCKYCYVPQFCHVKREEFHSAVTTAPDVLERLERDMKRVGVLPEPVFLCFTTDPYCVDAPEGITREAIGIIIRSGNRVNILTKGGMRAADDLLFLSMVPGNKIGATLTFQSLRLSMQWEPRATAPVSRIEMLELAKRRGIETWASIEPVIDPDQSLRIMEEALPYVDTFKIGKWNHDPRARAIDWKDFAARVRTLMDAHGKRYMFKRELREAIG